MFIFNFFFVLIQNIRWVEIRVRYGGAISCSSVAWTAAEDIQNLFRTEMLLLMTWTNSQMKR